MDASIPKPSYAVLLRGWAPFVVLFIACLAVFGLGVATERLSAGWWGIGPSLFALGILVGALVLLGVLTGHVWPSLLCMLLAAFAFAFGDSLAYYVGWKHLSTGEDITRDGRVEIFTIYFSIIGLPFAYVLGTVGRVVSFRLFGGPPRTEADSPR